MNERKARERRAHQVREDTESLVPYHAMHPVVLRGSTIHRRRIQDLIKILLKLIY